MLTRRRLLGASVAAAVATVLAQSAGATLGMLGGAPYGSSPPLAFDYYISPTGDDNNAGTLASPWSITALNSKWTTYSGKRVGLLPGTYQYGTVGGTQTTLYSIYQNSSIINSTNANVLTIQGGTSGSPTYIGSSDGSGNYSPRTAIIDCSNPSGGAAPTNPGSVFGQNQYNNLVFPSKWGYITYDGLVVKNFTFSAIAHLGSSGTPIPNVIVQNCEIYDGISATTNNPGAVWFDFSPNYQVLNCKIHDIQISAGVYGQNCAIIQFNTYGSVVKYNTTYNCAGFSMKDGFQHCAECAYNYFDFGSFGSLVGSSTQGCCENIMEDATYTLNFHHNILLGFVGSFGESSQMNKGTVNIYNNTFYKPTSAGYLVAWTDYLGSANTGGTGSFAFTNNLIYAQDGKYDTGAGAYPGAVCKMDAQNGGSSGTPGWSTFSANYNAYGSGMSWSNGFGGTTWTTLASWQALTPGYDANSIVELSGTPFSATPTAQVPSSFAISAASPAYTGASGGGICGACDSSGNASDGSGRVGCNF